jgi:hypothetical protein
MSLSCLQITVVNTLGQNANALIAVMKSLLLLASEVFNNNVFILRQRCQVISLTFSQIITVTNTPAYYAKAFAEVESFILSVPSVF